MADYTRITPPTLANLEPQINDPVFGEAANKTYQVFLQTRQFIFDFLDSKFDKTAGDVLKPGAVAAASLSGKVRGSTSNVGTQQEIVQGTVSTPDLRDDAVSTLKIANLAVTTAKIADLNVSTVKITDLAVSTAKIADLNVTTGKLANDAVDATKLLDDPTGAAGAVTTDHIRTNAVTAPKIAANVVNGDKLMLSGSASPRILVSDAAQKFQSVEMTGGATISAAGVVTITALGVAVVREKAANTVAGGASVAGGGAFATPNVRGVAVAWEKLFENILIVDSLAGIGTTGKIVLKAGTYVIEASCPGYGVGLHVCRLGRFNSSDVLQESVFGSTAAAQLGSQTVTCVQAKFTTGTSEYILFHHWTELVKATNGLGVPVSAGADEVYAQVIIRKVSS